MLSLLHPETIQSRWELCLIDSWAQPLPMLTSNCRSTSLVVVPHTCSAKPQTRTINLRTLSTSSGRRLLVLGIMLTHPLWPLHRISMHHWLEVERLDLLSRQEHHLDAQILEHTIWIWSMILCHTVSRHLLQGRKQRPWKDLLEGMVDREGKRSNKLIADGPSLALSISYANGGFYHTGFYSYQDTVCPSTCSSSSPFIQTNTSKIYVGKLSNSYMAQSVVAGQTDFFYGFGTLWVTNTQILLRSWYVYRNLPWK